MVKTIIATIATFFGLKLANGVLQILRWVWFAALLLLVLRVGIPLMVWYGQEVGKALTPAAHWVEGFCGCGGHNAYQ